jgi:hypothetical protein
MKVVSYALRIMYSICVWCSTPKTIDTLVDKRGVLLYLANEDHVKHTNKQLNKSKEEESVLNLFNYIKRKSPQENNVICELNLQLQAFG